MKSLYSNYGLFLIVDAAVPLLPPPTVEVLSAAEAVAAALAEKNYLLKTSPIFSILLNTLC